MPKSASDLPHESDNILVQFGDLSIEANCVALIEAMILGRVLPGDHRESDRLVAAVVKLPRGTMNKFIATYAQFHKTYSESAALLLKGFQDFYLTQSGAEASHTLFQG